MIIIITIMNLIILLLNPNPIVYIDIQNYKKYVTYAYTSDPLYNNGMCKQYELCDINKIKQLCDLTCDFDKKFINYIFVHNDLNIYVYHPLQLTHVTMFFNFKKEMGLLYFENKSITQLINIYDRKLINAQMEKICSDDITNDYKIVEIIYNNTKYYDVLVMLPTKKSLCECHNYDGIIYSIIMLKHHQIIGDIVNIIIKLIGLINIAQTYCEKHDENKKAKCVKFSHDHIEDIAFKYVFEKVVYDFIYS